MSFVQTNPNPAHRYTGDCVIRAISIAEDLPWDNVFISLMVESFKLKDMPSANHAWGSYLRGLGYHRYVIPDQCPDCYTVADFANEHPDGTYILATGTHAVAVKNGSYMDTWDSGEEIPVYYWKKEM